MIKTLLIKLIHFFGKYFKLNRYKSCRDFFQKIELAKLRREDEYEWNIQYAKSLGVKVGDNCRIYGDIFYSTEPYLIEIGDNTLISGSVSFITHDGAVFSFNDGKGDILGNFGRIKIGKNCFISFGATIMPDVEIGDNCLVAAKSLVTNSFPANSMIIGNPAKVVSSIEFYKRYKMLSKNTIRDSKFGFPNERGMPKNKLKEILLKHFDNHPIRKPRKRNR